MCKSHALWEEQKSEMCQDSLRDACSFLAQRLRARRVADPTMATQGQAAARRGGAEPAQDEGEDPSAGTEVRLGPGSACVRVWWVLALGSSRISAVCRQEHEFTHNIQTRTHTNARVKREGERERERERESPHQ